MSCGSAELYYLLNYTASHPGSQYLNTHYCKNIKSLLISSFIDHNNYDYVYSK